MQYQIVPNTFTLITEISVYLLFLSSFIIAGKYHKTYKLHLSLLYLLFVLSALSSALINSCDVYQTILSIRLVLRFYLIYLAIINIEFDDDEIFKINKILLYLFIIQLPVQAIKFYFYGIGEDTIGTYGTHGGGITTVLPLVALGYLIAYYCLFKDKLIYLILGLWFIAYGIIGAKLALLFLYPISFFFLFYLNHYRIKGIRIPRDIYIIAIISILIISVGIPIIKYQRRTNAEGNIGGSVNLSYALKSSLKYTTGTRAGNPELAKGRFATTKLTLKTLWEEGYVNLTFGYGPGVTNKLMRQQNKKYNYTRVEKIALSYGHTGVVYIISEYGIIGLILIIIIYLTFIKNCWKLYKKEKEPYWKAFASGSLFFSGVMFFIIIAYNKVPIAGDTIPPVFFFCMAVVYDRLKNKRVDSTKVI